MRLESFPYAGSCELLQTSSFPPTHSRVLLDGSRMPHTERLESRGLSMDARKHHLTFPLTGWDKAGSICGLLGELPRGLS